MEPIIFADKLTKQYKSVTAVKNATISIDAGCFYSIMGRSGSGKTTLLSLLGILDDATEGELYIEGCKVSSLSDKEKSNIRMRDLGFVFQEFHLNPKLRAFENVMVPMYINPMYKGIDMKSKAIELLELLGLKDRVTHFPSELSGGEQQRVAIARALANDPKCIFADEPTGNLDVESEKLVFDYLKMLSKKGKSIVVVSHNEIVLDYADKIYYMNEGDLKEKNHEDSSLFFISNQ